MERVKELWESYRYQLLILVAVVGLVGAWLLKRPATSPNQLDQTLAMSSTGSMMSAPSTNGGQVCVDVKGAVKHPGIYKLKGGARVNEAVAAAGGTIANADMKQVNLAKQLADAEVVYVPVNGETIPGTSTAGAASAGPTAGSSSQTTTVNLNTATKEQLCQITGIGDKKADLILQYREQHGQFKSVDELKQVSGFGDKSVEKIRDQLAV
ncbi:MAG TPA: helix-hairpin-helix domain-containing protein [Candidatus Limosilactobacillus intestinigallinarum]|nr:helix-hairpin-helix domain-containing protein [Candidatus Limosilactobacillus intestinigallinarum]